MKLFLFEFATCGEKIDDSIAVEGLAMFKSLYTGFKRIFEINSFVREEFQKDFQLPYGDLSKIAEYAENSDLFLIVAPEDDDTLFRLTKLCEKFCFNLGSSSKAIQIVADKWRLYKKLKGKVNMPKTSKKVLESKFVIKPRKSCGGEGIQFSDYVPNDYIAQEYIEGKNLSVSIIAGDCPEVVSINEQILNGFKYSGAVIPARIEGDVAFEVAEEALKAVECIRGLRGYVGVDIVYSNIPYVIEINARLTTPSIAFEQVYQISSAEMIYKGLFENLELPKTFCRHMIRKEMGKCYHPYVRVGNYSLVISKYEN